MCFSATGSFAISGALTAIGVVSMGRTASKPHRMFAAVPFLFAAQQAAEGTVWLTVNGGHATLNRLAVSVFLGIALVVWPTWLPFALRLVEQSPGRRRALGALFWLGAAVGVYAAVFMARFRPIAHVAGHSIRYDYVGRGDASSEIAHLLAYALPTVVPFFVSTLNLARAIGALLVVSLVATVIVERDALTSVWCFFAAILSGLIVVAVERDQRARAPAPAAASLRPGR